MTKKLDLIYNIPQTEKNIPYNCTKKIILHITGRQTEDILNI